MRVVPGINYIPFLHIMYTESVQRAKPFFLRFIFHWEKSEKRIKRLLHSLQDLNINSLNVDAIHISIVKFL